MATMKPPGTHTNSEVKEALHARARLRTYCISALVILLLACLLVIYNTAQEYENEEAIEAAPKMVIVVAGDLSYPAVALAKRSEKAPFIHQLVATGGSLGKLQAKYETGGSALVKLLTGDNATNALTLEGQQSFLRRVKEAGYKPAIVAPPSYWSATATDALGACPRVGLLDTECSGMACPGQNADAYCNTAFKYTTCEGVAQFFADDVVQGFRRAAESGADLIYIQAEGIQSDLYDSQERPISSMLERFSNISLLDSFMGEIALSLTQRTSTVNENWLMALTSEGQNNYFQAPLFISVYSRGMTAQLRNIPETAKTTDIVPTVLRWFDVSQTEDDVVGICSNGKKIKNCDV